MDKPLEPGVRKKGRNTYQVSTEYLKEDFEKMGPEKFKQLMKDKKPKTMKKGGLSAGQKKIAAKAPPPDKIDAKDFAVLKAEKAKGRGMGLQDEKLKPGKVMKAKRGKFLGSGLDFPVISSVKPTVNKTKRAQNLSRMKIEFTKQKNRAGRPSSSLSKSFSKTIGVFPPVKGSLPSDLGKSFSKTIGVFPQISSGKSDDFVKRRMELAGPKDIAKQALKSTRIGKIALGIGAAGVAASQYLKSKMKKDEPKKKMVGGMAKKYSVGGGADMGRVGEYKSKLATASDRVRRKKKEDRITQRDLDFLEGSLPKKMGGGMAKKYSNGMTDKTFTDPKTAMIAHSMKTEDKIYKRDREAAKMLEKKAPKGMYSSFMEEKKAIDKVKASKKILGRMGGGMMQRPMGGPMGGMMQRPMGYKKGTMVKARGCKLGRTRPTKMY
jgi:hypothetical protein